MVEDCLPICKFWLWKKSHYLHSIFRTVVTGRTIKQEGACCAAAVLVCILWLQPRFTLNSSYHLAVDFNAGRQSGFLNKWLLWLSQWSHDREYVLLAPNQKPWLRCVRASLACVMGSAQWMHLRPLWTYICGGWALKPISPVLAYMCYLLRKRLNQRYNYVAEQCKNWLL